MDTYYELMDDMLFSYEVDGIGSWKLPQKVRWLCTDVWPMLYHVLTILQKNGIAVWQLTKDRAMKLLPQKGALAETMGVFYQAVCTYYSGESSVENALKVIETGLAFLQSVQSWWSDANAH